MLPSKDRTAIVVLVGLIVVASVLLLFAVPVSHGFSVRAAYLGPLDQCPAFLAVTIPKAASASFHWTTPSLVEFGVWNCASGERIVYENGTSGSGSFTSSGGSYGFSSICGYGGYPCPPANVTGTYDGPLFAL